MDLTAARREIDLTASRGFFSRGFLLDAVTLAEGDPQTEME